MTFRNLGAWLLVGMGLSPAACRTDASPGARPDTSARPAEHRAAAVVAPAASAEPWSSNAIDWQPFGAGLALARAQHRPICLVLYTSWCPHCRNYSHVFADPRVVRSARDFVMIRVNADEEEDVASQFQLDGGYVPRTYFLASNGAVDPEIHAARPNYLYFYDEHEPAALLGGMETAMQKLRN